ncbi:MAG: 30S ribosomal protein S16 [Candidatus Latescibacterota bacterium]
MAVRLRMRRMGSHKRPFYRLVAADTRYQRDGRFLEILGYYDPKQDPYVFKVDKDKVMAWLQQGALMSPTAEGLLRKEGILQTFQQDKATAKKSKKSAPVAGESVENTQ